MIAWRNAGNLAPIALQSIGAPPIGDIRFTCVYQAHRTGGELGIRPLVIYSLTLVTAVLAAAACGSKGTVGGATTPTGPTAPADTSKKSTPPLPVLDSLRRGVYDQNNILHFYPDTLDVTPPSVGAVTSFPFTGFIAFTSAGPITDAPSMQGFFGAFVVTSDNPPVIAPGGNCNGGDGSPCLTLKGAQGNANVTVSLGSKNLITLIRVH